MIGAPRLFLVAATLLLGAPGPPAAAAESPVAVELFTSQGCDACPPADAFLGELAARGDVLPLGFHVTYWDRLGREDTFGRDAFTERQWDYARRRGERRVYTPQMVVGGLVDAVGSDRGRVSAAIALLRERGPSLAVTVEGEGKAARLRLPAGGAGAAGGGAVVWLAGFDRARDVAVRRGENAGRVLRYHNVVRDLERLGTWSGGAPPEPPLPLARLRAAGRAGAAVLVQRRSDGAIIGAMAIDLRNR